MTTLETLVAPSNDAEVLSRCARLLRATAWLCLLLGLVAAAGAALGIAALRSDPWGLLADLEALAGSRGALYAWVGASWLSWLLATTLTPFLLLRAAAHALASLGRIELRIDISSGKHQG